MSVTSITAFIVRQSRYARELMPAATSASKGMSITAGIVTVSVLAVCSWWAVAQRTANKQLFRRLLFFGPAWYAITIAPMVVTYVSPRHLYITAAGLSIAVASLLLPAYPAEDRRRTNARVAMAGALLLLYAVASIRNVSDWVVNGRESYGLATSISRTLKTLKPGSFVFVRATDRYNGLWFWSWATPFALQPPFTDEDLYKTFRVVERPEMYCCPIDQWAMARKETLSRLITSPGTVQVTYIDFTPTNSGAATLGTRTVDTQALRQQIEAALGKPIESVVATMTPADAEQVAGLVLR